MTLRPVLKNPNDLLRTKAKKVPVALIQSLEVQTLIDDLTETMNIENGVGIGSCSALGRPSFGARRRLRAHTFCILVPALKM